MPYDKPRAGASHLFRYKTFMMKGDIYISRCVIIVNYNAIYGG